MSQDREAKKRRAAEAALAWIEGDAVLGVGTGSTVNAFIDLLAEGRAPQVRRAISSSEASSARLRAIGIELVDLNAVNGIPLYVDGADEANAARQLVKGGGGALTREKIIASAAARFVCMVDDSKLVKRLGRFPLPVEVIPMARELICRRVNAHGGRAIWRRDFVTDNGNQILDCHGLRIEDAVALERELGCVAGVVTVGLFAIRPADVLLVAGETDVQTIEAEARLPPAGS